MNRHLVVGILAVVAATAGCQASSPTASPEPTPGAHAAVRPTPVYDPEEGPLVAEVGVSYPFALTVACGTNSLSFGQTEWVHRVPADGVPKPAPGGQFIPYGISVDEHGLPVRYLGTMTLVDRKLLRFTFADSRLPPSVSFDLVPVIDGRIPAPLDSCG
jgi:hypothetical protein